MPVRVEVATRVLPVGADPPTSAARWDDRVGGEVAALRRPPAAASASVRSNSLRRGTGTSAPALSRRFAHARAEEPGAAGRASPRLPCSMTRASKCHVPGCHTRYVDLELLEATLADARRARLPRPPGLGVGRARRRVLRGDDEPARRRCARSSPAGAVLVAGGRARGARRATAPRRRSSRPPTGGRSRPC